MLDRPGNERTASPNGPVDVKPDHEKHDPKTAEHAENLCTRCQNLEVTRLQWVSQTRTRWLGRPSRWFSEEACMLCNFFLRIARQTPGYNENNPLWLTPHLARDILISDSSKETDPTGHLVGWTLAVGKGRVSSHEMQKPRTWFLPQYTANSPPLSAPIGGSRVQRNTADFTQMRKWLKYCMGHHHGICRKTPMTPIADLLVIDCHTRLILPAPRDCGYAALSYIWGCSPTEEPTIFKDRLPEKCPKVIEDAITVARKLDIQYLWVDRYCIDQDNRDSKHDLIRNMHLIYQRARVTLIDAAGEGPHHGLAGVNDTPREPQPFVTINSQTWVAIPNPAQDIAKSIWSTRGWTYQEGMLSRRRLFFTKTQVYFQCKGMHCVESLSVDLSYYHILSPNPVAKRNSGFSSSVNGLRALPYEGTRPTYYDILPRLREYLARQLSYDSDALNAFRGVLESFRTYEIYCDLYWDDPRTDLNNSADELTALYHVWGVFYRKNAARPAGKSTDTKHPSGFLWSLLWKPSMDTQLVDLSERDEFPSWSWTHWKGLKGIITMWQEEDQWNGDDEVEIDLKPKILLNDNSGKPIDIQDYERMIDDPKVSLYLSPCLELSAFITPMKLRWTSVRWFQPLRKVQLLQPTMKLRLEHNYQILPGAEAEVLVDMTKNSNHEYQLLGQDCFVVLLVRFLGYKGLILQKVEEGIYKRIGTMEWHIMYDTAAKLEGSRLEISFGQTPARPQNTIVLFHRETFALV